MKIYRIKKELIGKYVTRETNKKMKIAIITMLLLYILMFAFTKSYGVHKLLIPPLSMLFFIILTISYFSILFQGNNIADLTCFVFSEESISRFLNKEKLNVMTKIGVSRNEHKYGVKFNQVIKFSEIESTSINKNEIIIESINYDFFTSNGKILIPQEMENYELVKAEIIKNSDKYCLLAPNDG